MSEMSANEIENVEAAIREVFDAGCAAWNRGDMEGYLASYWDSDRTLWISGGSLTRGREAIVAAYRSRFATPQQMGRIAVTDLQVNVLTPTDAMALGRWTLVTDIGSSNGFFTVQLTKIEGRWLFLSDHSSTSA